MADRTGISWTDSTWNPWHGCTKVSPGCTHCYAETWRFRKAEWGPRAERVKTSKGYWKNPIKWSEANDWMECVKCGWRGEFKETIAAGTVHVCPACEGNLQWARRRVFASMCDPFEDNRQVADWRGEWFKVIEDTPNLDWQILTKRPENIFSLGTDAVGEWDLWLARQRNVWLGASVENQDYFEPRVKALIQNGIQAQVLFLSVEPMLGPVRLTPVPMSAAATWWQFTPGEKTKIDWIICGGESGDGCRPMDVQWARDLRDDCKTWGVKFFMKQLGGYPDKCDKLTDLPKDLRIRELPTPRIEVG